MRAMKCIAALTLVTAGLCVACADGEPAREIPAPADEPGSAGDVAPSQDETSQEDADAAPLDPAMAARVQAVQGMIDQGMDITQADAEGRTALMLAAFDGYTEVVDLLLEHGAQVDRPDGVGRTALMYASSGPFPETVKALLDRGADVNRVDTNEGWTALMLAAAEGHQPVVELLLERGANPAVADMDGDTAVDHAQERGQTAIVKLLGG